MAYFPNVSFYISRNVSNILKRISVCSYCTATREVNVTMKIEDDMPVKLDNPYAQTEKPQCILCKYNIEPNYKNVRLLSQFVSRYTGKIIPRHITGICEHKHKKICQEIVKARKAFLMPKQYKFPKFFEDPLLFNMENMSKPRRII